MFDGCWMKSLAASLAITSGLLLAGPVAAQPTQPLEVDVCLCRQLLSRFLCKPKAEVEFIGQQGKVYVFNVFYASKYSNFLCSHSESMVRVESKDLLRKRGAMVYGYNPDNGCAVGLFENPSCTLFSPKVRCCKQDIREEHEKKLEDEFWDRPVPENLPPAEPAPEEKAEPESEPAQ